MSRVLGVIQARMGSTRLPGKVLLPLGEDTVLGWVVRAALDSGALDDLVVATTTESVDDAVVAECARLGVAVHRGPVDDVLSRFIGALDVRPADLVARFNADSPLLDPAVVELTVRVARTAGVDYVSTALVRRLPLGLDAEVARADVLRAADQRATGYHRAHVTSYVWSNPEQFRLLGLTMPPDRSTLRLTLDTPDDWTVIQSVVEGLGAGPFPVAKLVAWLEDHPHVRAINAHVTQKELESG